MMLGRNVKQDQIKMLTKMRTLPFLRLALSPFVIFDSDYALISCHLCKSKTLWNIFLIIGRNVEQGQATCHVQECFFFFFFFFFLNYLRLFCLK